MQTLEPLIFIAGALIIAGITAAITAAYYRQKNRGLYNRTWNAAREYFTSDDYRTRNQ